METLIEIIKGRRSIRRYKPDKVPREKIVELFSVASFAPSSCNLQAWHFILVDEDELKRKVVHAGKVNRQVLSAPSIIVATYNRNVTREHYANYQSLAAAIQNFLLLAHAEGLGTLWVCNFRDEGGIRDVLGIPDTHKVLAIIEVGYPRELPKAPKRNPVEDFVSFNRFSSASTIPRTTFLSHWRWSDILDWQKRFSWRGYPLEKVTDAERREIPRLIIPYIDNENSLELFTLSGYLSSEINRQSPLVDHHFAFSEIYDAACNFEPSIAKRQVFISEHVDKAVTGLHKNYLLINKLEHMPLETFQTVLKQLSESEDGIKIIILFKNRYSWFGLYDFIVRNLLRKNGIDDIFFGSLRNLGPWKLRSRRWLKRILKECGFKVINTEGLFCMPAYRFDNSEWIKSRKYFSIIFKSIYFASYVLEILLRFTRLNRYVGEQVLFISRLEKGRG